MFATNDIQKGHAALIEADELQPSHMYGQKNVNHFLDEAQPKNRKDGASKWAAGQIANNIRPEQITSMSTAYTGAPVVNARGEVIQGNNRAAALRQMSGESKKRYREYLKAHAEELGFTAEDVDKMKNPVLVNMADVDDERAIQLGQYEAADTESGGRERIKPKHTAMKIGKRMDTFARILLKSTDDESSLAQLIDANGEEELDWMKQKGYITPTQYQSAFDTKGNLTDEAKNDLRGILFQSIFNDANEELEEIFNRMPSKAQRAILATAYRDYDSPKSERMIEEIKSSIRAYSDLMEDEAFANSKNYKIAKYAADMWKSQYYFDDMTGESYLPAEKYSNFALELAVIYKSQTQRYMQSVFNGLYDYIQGTVHEDMLFDKGDPTMHTLAEAIKKVLGIEYQPSKQNQNGKTGSNTLGSNDAHGPKGGQGGAGGTEAGRGSKERAGETEPAGGTGEDGRGAAVERRKTESVQQKGTPSASSREGGQGNAPADEQGGRGDTEDTTGRQPRDLAEAEVDNNGHEFVKSSDGTTTFGEIRPESGLTPAPIKLSEGFNNIDEDGNNIGYGRAHIDAGHGKEIREAGYPSIEAFVEDVSKNYGEIRIGRDRKSNSTYMLLEYHDDQHKRTLYIELSHDGSYWNVNSGGIFRNGYVEKKDIVWPEPTVGNSASTNATEVAGSSAEAAKGETADRGGNSSQPISTGKGSKKSTSEQEKTGKVAPEDNKGKLPVEGDDGLTDDERNSVTAQ
jgi:hypothetical protein